MRPNPDVVAQRVGNEIVLVHLRTNRIYSLNPTGAKFWELLVAGCDEKMARERMIETFDVEPARLEREVDELVASLRKENLLG